VSPLGALRDALARVTRAAEAIRDGEIELACAIIDDLAADIWNVIEAEERAA
jgi:hypothetical protein